MGKYDYAYLSESQIKEMMNEEMIYRQKKGDTCPPDENLCRYCRNVNRTAHYCWDCDRGSLYVPLTFPLYNIVLMLSSLLAGLEDISDKEHSSESVMLQQGVIEALKFAIQPFGALKTSLGYFADEILSNEPDYSNPGEIEGAVRAPKLDQHTESAEENTYRAEIGTIPCHQNACGHCKYAERIASPFCWDCDRGYNFQNGIRSLGTIAKALMHINTVMGEAIQSGHRDEKLISMRIGFAEGLKWVIKPFTTEEALIEEQGLEYVTQEYLESIVNIEDEEYERLKNLLDIKPEHR